MQEIRCPKCGEVFQVDESCYDQIAQQVRDKEFEKELERRKKELDDKREQELKVIRLQEEKEHTASLTQKDRGDFCQGSEDCRVASKTGCQ